MLIAFSSVCLGGINSDWWTYLVSAAFNVMAYALYDMCLVLLVSIFVHVDFHSCNGNIHNIVCGSLPPFHTSFLL